MRCGFLGLSHLGLVHSTVTASLGWDVVQFSPSREVVSLLNSRGPDVYEPGLRELWQSTELRRTVTADEEQLHICDLLVVAPDVVTSPEGESDLSEVDVLMNTAIKCASVGAPIILLSQVPPGYTRKFSTTREQIFYQVETLVFGLAVQRALSPERIIVGASHGDEKIPEPYAEWLRVFSAPVHVMRFESAELAKISINLFLAAFLSTTNSLAELAESVGADWAEIEPTLRTDRRFGEYAYLSPGLGISGGNIERDLVTFRRLAAASHVNDAVISSFIHHSAYRKHFVVEQIRRTASNGDLVVGLLGLSYKVGTGSTKNSPSILTIQALPTTTFVAHDPIAMLSPGLSNARQCATLEEVIHSAAVIAIMTPWPEYSGLLADSEQVLREKIAVIDPFGVLPTTMFVDSACRHVVLGRGELT